MKRPNSLKTECRNLAIKLMSADCEVQAVENTLVEFFSRAYGRGYQDCQTDHRKSRKASQHHLEANFATELGIIDDVMASPYDVETT